MSWSTPTWLSSTSTMCETPTCSVRSSHSRKCPSLRVTAQTSDRQRRPCCEGARETSCCSSVVGIRTLSARARPPGVLQHAQHINS